MDSEAAAERRGKLPVFAAGGRQWTVGEVLDFAPQRLSGAPAAAEPAPAGSDAAALDAAVRAFRYERRLLSAEDCRAWLAARELGVGDLRASVQRRLTGTEPATPGMAQIDRLLAPGFGAAARALAARVAAAIEADSLPGEGDADWIALDAAYQAFVAATLTPKARERALVVDRLQWLRVDCEVVEFDQLDAAREARLCVEDGQSLREVAEMGRFAYRSGRFVVSALPKSWAQALFRIRPGTATQPIVDGERLLVLGLRRLVEPDLADPEIADGIDASLLQPALEALLARRIRWLLPGLGSS